MHEPRKDRLLTSGYYAFNLLKSPNPIWSIPVCFVGLLATILAIGELKISRLFADVYENGILYDTNMIVASIAEMLDDNDGENIRICRKSGAAIIISKKELAPSQNAAERKEKEFPFMDIVD